ncbi:SDR family NAD(P)-dependent oxidoreductase [Rhizobium sp. Root482]|uniref:SDR family NAD(P)-dependent oxidoreductase n=1 Tax=Rhizobium sp. Root482 TaxID=1736543 RepID=UPI0006F656AD|nr:glucose 1-dehydrogenase [Rhizobium sp. Root482]KQY16303.1 short-chain dehydrogenase [Rhizobium sp. Root482]
MLDHQVAVVTGGGGARGIGGASARRLAEAGCWVAILDINAEAATTAAAALGEGHIGIACDVSDPEACRSAIAVVTAQLGVPDILVNNAGVSQPDRLLEITQERFDLVVNVSLRGTLNMVQAVAPGMIERGSGTVVNIGSMAAQIGGGIFGGPHYAAAKGGVHSITKSMARELAPHGIRVNAISPGPVDTDIFGDRMTEDRRREIIAGIPLGRMAVADDVAKACYFLSSELSSYITGVILDVNGGRFMH